MKLSHLKQLVQEYDNNKELSEDTPQMHILKELISDREMLSNANSDPEITLQDYQNFADTKGYNVDLSDSYLASNSAGSRVFAQWKQTELANQIISQAISSILSSSQPVPSINLDNFKLTPLTLEMPSPITFLSSIDNEALNKQLFSASNACGLAKEDHWGQDQPLAKHISGMNSTKFYQDIKINTDREQNITPTQEQQLRFRDTTRIRKAARGLAQLYRQHGIFRQLPKNLCFTIIAQCSDGSHNEEQAMNLAEAFFDKPKLMPK